MLNRRDIVAVLGRSLGAAKNDAIGSPRNGLHLHNEASYDNGLICGGTWNFRPRFCRTDALSFWRRPRFDGVCEAAKPSGFGIGVVDTSQRLR